MIQTPFLNIKIESGKPSAGLDAVGKLFRALNQQGLRYCHWKSNVRLEQALNGRTDLDLLVDCEQGRIFRQILHDHHVKSLVSAPGKEYPGIENYLGFDPHSGRLFHLHVHYQLVLGEQFVKNYHLPLEPYFLDLVQLQHGVKVPLPELEIVVLSIRALLKYRDRDVIKDVLSIRSTGLPFAILQEIKYLFAQTSEERITETLAEIEDIVPADIVLEFLNTVREAPRSGRKLFRLRGRLRRAIRPYQRDNRLQATLRYQGEMWHQRKSFLKLAPNRKMTLAHGGVTTALVGADGAGKSTMREPLVQWLRWKLDVHVYYLGSKETSRRSRLIYLCFRMARRGHRDICRGLGEHHPVARFLEIVRDTLRYTHDLSIGWERYSRYLAGRKQALAGSIVIYDRYPLETITHSIKHPMMDSRRIRVVAGGVMAPITRIFSRMEQHLYDNIRPPDHLLVLDVSPNVSMQRKPDHDRSAIETKSQAVSALLATVKPDSGGVNIIAIDANLPAEDVLSQLKTKLWEIL